MCVAPATVRPGAAHLGVGGWLTLTATPVFALMAVLSAGMDDVPDLHGPGMDGSMALMYALMSVFHAAPWLTLLASRRRVRET